MQILKEETAAMTLMVCLVNLPDKAQSVAQMLDAWLVASLYTCCMQQLVVC